MKELPKKAISFYWNEVFPNYAWAIIRHWWVIVVCSVGAGLGALIDMGGFDIQGWVWWSLGIGGVFVAQFLAWNDIRKERDSLRRYDVEQSTLTSLMEFRSQLVGMQNEKLNSESEVGGWKQRHSNLRAEIMKFIHDNVSPAEEKLFETLGDYTQIALVGKEYVNFEHFDITARIIRDRRWLEKAVQDYGRQRFRPELAAEMKGVNSNGEG